MEVEDALAGTDDTKWMTPMVTSKVSIPVGGIIMWSGAVADIPKGWALCDGTNGTPDLRNRFVIGAGSSYNPGSTGGSTSISTTPYHTHSGTATLYLNPDNAGEGASYTSTWPKVTRTLDTMLSLSGGGEFWYYNVSGSSKAAASSNFISLNVSGSGSSSVSVLNPYYALCFIMFIAEKEA